MYTDTLPLNHDFIQEIRQVSYRKVNPSRFIKLERKIRKASERVQKEWNSFSSEEREALRELAYEILSYEQMASSVACRGILPRLRAIGYMIFLKVTDQEEDLNLCVDAIDCFIDNILDAIEREDISYQKQLSDTLEELRDNSNLGECS